MFPIFRIERPCSNHQVFRKPLELVLDLKEDHYNRVVAVREIGLSGDPKALAMLAIISAQVKDATIKYEAIFWLKDMLAELNVSSVDGYADDLIEIAANYDDPNKSIFQSMIEDLTSGKNIEVDYSVDNLTRRSSYLTVPKTTPYPSSMPFGLFEGMGDSQLGDLLRLGGKGLQSNIPLASGLPNFSGAFHFGGNPKDALDMVLGLCRQAKSDNQIAAMTLSVLKSVLPMNTEKHERFKELSTSLPDEDQQLLREYGLI